MSAIAATAGSKSVARTMDAANCAAVLLSVPISYHFHGCTALLVALVVVSGAILNTHFYLYLTFIIIRTTFTDYGLLNGFLFSFFFPLTF